MEESTHRDHIIKTFSGAAATYETVGPRPFSFFARALVEFAGVDLEGDVLDVATGTGAVLVAVVERGKRSGRLVGVDLVPDMLARAADEFDQRSFQGIELQHMDGERLDFDDGSFDTVLCSFGLQAFSNKQAALIGFHRVLRPEGRIGVVYPLGWHFESDPRWAWQADVLRSFGALSDDGHDIGPRDVMPAIRAAGFSDVEGMEVTCPLEFRDEDEWWAWAWSHGSRSLFEAVPTPRLPELRKALTGRLDACREADGLIHGSMSALMVRGLRRDTGVQSHRSPRQSGSV